MRFIQRIVRWFSLVLFALAGAALMLMMFNVVADITGKYLFRRPVPGTIQIVSWYYMVAVAFLPVAYVQIVKEHLFVELFTMSVGPRGLAAIDTVVEIGGSVYAGLLAVLVFEDALESTARRDVQDVTFFDMPIWPASWILPLSFGLLALVFALQALLDARHALTGERPPPTFGQDPTHKDSA